MGCGHCPTAGAPSGVSGFTSGPPGMTFLPTPQADASRRASHPHASTSPRCVFSWVTRVIHEDLTTWNAEDMASLNCSLPELYAQGFTSRYEAVSRTGFGHILGKGGRTVHLLESFFGVLISIREQTSEVEILGPRRACASTAFVVKHLASGGTSLLHHLSSIPFPL